MLSMLTDEIVDVSTLVDCIWRFVPVSSCVTIINGTIGLWLLCKLVLWLLKLMIIIMLIERKDFCVFSIFLRQVVCQNVLFFHLIFSSNSIISLVESTGCADESETENDTSSSKRESKKKKGKTYRCHSSIRSI